MNERWQSSRAVKSELTGCGLYSRRSMDWGTVQLRSVTPSKSIEEARQYLNHPVLGKRLLECTEAVVYLKGGSGSDIFGYPDDLKFKSSMTLFEKITGTGSVFSIALDRYCHGDRDAATLRFL